MFAELIKIGGNYIDTDPWLGIIFTSKDKEYTTTVNKGNYIYLCTLAKDGLGSFTWPKIKKLNSSSSVRWKVVNYQDILQNADKLPGTPIDVIKKPEAVEEPKNLLSLVSDIVPDEFLEMSKEEQYVPSVESIQETIRQADIITPGIESIQPMEAGIATPFKSLWPLLVLGGLIIFLKSRG